MVEGWELERGGLLVVAVSGCSYGARTADDDVGCEGGAGAEASTAGGTDEGVGNIVTVEGSAVSTGSDTGGMTGHSSKESLTS